MKVPFAGDPFQDVHSMVLKHKPRSGYEVPNSGGDEDFAWGGHGRYPCADVHRYSPNLVIFELNFARVHPWPGFGSPALGLPRR